ncbi:PREDICTED: zinc finger RNA-binding protein isoform X1 [Brassica oleracea var. oleracea]|uniref:zinc finger RNA-binding protein isoform X1 n=1 Tax=Brassica oleracea var. oleracea TaxID=109376 RepID=UPI0006A6B8B0|nr:PREDICTED: zinc finger RNA-binding protein isoform X1 [Brassica oleracea var. oleracea]
MMTTAEGEYSKAKTSVWWDIENCEVPKGWDAHAIAQNVSSALLNMNYGGPVSISAYGDTNLIPHAVQQALSSTGVGLNHVPAGVKDASDKKILVDMLLWAVDNPAPANFMLISGDRDFSNALHQLSMRRYTILLAQPPRASAPLVAAAKNVWLWTSLASGGPPLTSGESSRLVNNGRGLVSNSEAAKDQVSEQAQTSKPTTLSTSVAGDTKDHKTRENHVPRAVPQDECKGATGESVTSSDSLKNVAPQKSDKRHTSQAASVPSQKTQASVKAKPVQEAKLSEPVFCSICQISCATKDAYTKHTYGKRHRSNLELSKEVLEKQNVYYHCRLCDVTCQRQVVFDSHLRGQKHAAMLSQSEALNDSKKHQEKGVREKDQPREAVAKPKSYTDYVCGLCNVVCKSQSVFDSHLSGKKHASMLSQSKELIGSKKLQEKGVGEKDIARETVAEPKPKAVHVCRLCNVTCQSPIVFESHLRGQKHAAMLTQSEALVDSNKLQEKGVGEKDRLIEAIGESQLQSQMAQENSKCLEKHVAMVNQSEALINSKKLEEKVQPIETILEPQSQFQNPQENTKFLEKPNVEVREICGTTKSNIKENNSSTKDWVETSFFGDLLCDSKAPEESRECFDGTVKPVNLSGGATEKEKEVMVPQAIAASNKSYGSQGLSTVVTNKNHTTPGFVASDGAKSSVSTNHITKEPNVCPVFCHVCQISCDSKVAFENHIYGKIHQQKNEERLKKILNNNHAAMVKEQTEQAHVDSRRTRQEVYQKELEHAHQENETTLVKTKDHVFQGAQQVKEEVKEINHISESVRNAISHACPELNQESCIPKELRLERVQLPADRNVTKKFEDWSKHNPLPTPSLSVKDCWDREAAEREDAKVQPDNFWTRLWGKKS